jgi:hypothetical protein
MLPAYTSLINTLRENQNRQMPISQGRLYAGQIRKGQFNSPVSGYGDIGLETNSAKTLANKIAEIGAQSASQ